MEQGGKVLVLPVNGNPERSLGFFPMKHHRKFLNCQGRNMSATSIAEELNLPLTTVKYNLASLIKSNLIKVKQIK